MIFLRYVLELAIIIPGIIFAVLPFLDNLKYNSLRAYFIMVIAEVFVLLAGAVIRYKYSLSNSEIIIPLAVLFFVVYVVIINANLGRKLFCYFNSLMLCTFCRLYALFVMAPLEAENEMLDIMSLFTLKSCIIYLALAFVVLGLFFGTLKTKIPVLMCHEYISKVWNILFVVPMSLTLLICWSVPIHPNLAMVGRLRSAALIILWLMLMVILLLYNIFWWMAEKFSEGSRLQQENTLLMMEGKRYQELRAYMNETRALRHDFRQHILVITQLAGSQKFTELKNYLEHFTDASDKFYRSYCGNIAVDAVASHYTAYAEGRNIKIDWRLKLPSELPINEAEYCAMLGNLTENALKAVADLPGEKRSVKIISSLLAPKIIGLSIDNPFRGKIKLDKNGLPVSNYQGHGIGLTSVLNTVNRYNGSMKISINNNIFSADIILYCN